MKGQELREWLIDNKYTLAEIARLLSITPQGLNTKLRAASLKSGFIKEVARVINKSTYELQAAVERTELPKLSEKKEVIPLGKHTHTRLTADEYIKAYEGWKGLPMYNVPVTASFVETYRDEAAYHPLYYLHDPRFKDCSFGAIITGDSMHSEIRHGDFVMCQEITDRRFLVYGDIYYIVGTNGLETCKYLNAHPSDPDSLMLVARNEKISPSPIPKDMIQRLFKVKGILRGY